MPTPYGYHWRTITRPALLRRAGGVFDDDGRYLGGARCARCGIPDLYPLSLWQRSTLDGAHLDGNIANDAEDNTAALCRTCHRANDYPSWAAKFKEYLRVQRDLRLAEKDAARPILEFLRQWKIRDFRRTDDEIAAAILANTPVLGP